MSLTRNIGIACTRLGAVFGCLALLLSGEANAVDGCKVRLCITGNWQNIAVCRPVVEEAMHDVERGRGWPECSEAPGVNLEWTTEATCPVFYSLYNPDSGAWARCQYGAIVRSKINNAPWADMFWVVGTTSTSTRYYPPARAALGANIDPTYDRDFASYVPPPPPAPCIGGDAC